MFADTSGYLRAKKKETSSIARRENNKMKALAFLTMIFLPATFVAVNPHDKSPQSSLCVSNSLFTSPLSVQPLC
ncbi:hypothetical protein B0T26DRAFT_710726 [Lasiosphaeria miniovina]|uniref:Uncharacterized protein n=1 Tax=Lasiosphaeria miniovina TaxID=1954250 RepID=A0AA40AL16_9PEZI|nr:uncharacterized protein B0T26DRAFT_710726 [Lasiosphaeria miniovina]KAK0717735.1 hypothetical protein B0T26DRAFT_710726 [Lasiosphaeria miniovina]